ncbi:MAG: hypothetical protein IPI91_12055 [Flavobacteriales bacterium]|nr:hypothetical protein [Flavobacteriales bacterium]
MKQGRIAITGMGAICSLGNDVSAISDALISGKRGIRPLQKLDLGFPDLFGRSTIDQQGIGRFATR